MRLQVERTTASEIVGSPTSSRMKRSAAASVSAIRSRTATPARLVRRPERDQLAHRAAPPGSVTGGLAARRALRSGRARSASSDSSTSSRSMRASFEAMIAT